MNEDGASGSCVVEAVLKLLEDSKIFPPDHGFMRRIAYVETRDGTNIISENTNENNLHEGVGIWGLTHYFLGNMRHALQHDPKYRSLFPVSEKIYEQFGVSMTGNETLNMTNPVVSGIAAHFFLHYLIVLKDLYKIPEDIAGQASFWANIYHIGANPTVFEEGVMELEGMTEYSV